MTKNKNNNNTNLEQSLWAAADKLRNNMDAAEYKHGSGPDISKIYF